MVERRFSPGRFGTDSDSYWAMLAAGRHGVSHGRPRGMVGRTRRQLAAELITCLAVIDKKIKQANAR